MKKYFLHFSFVFMLLSCVGFSASRPIAIGTVPPSLELAIEQAFKLPEAEALLNQVQKEGTIFIKTAPFGDITSNALWDGARRTIVLNSSKKRPLGAQIRSILFELHNAASNKYFIQLDKKAWRGDISKKDYVEAVEFEEYKNVRKTCTLIEKGIRAGYFPKETYWNVAPSFSEHFRMQMHSGHSGQIAKFYDRLAPLS